MANFRPTPITALLLLCGLLLGCEASPEAANDAGSGATDAVIDAGLDTGTELPDLFFPGTDTTTGDQIVLECPGGAYCPCDDANDCNSGYCVDAPIGKVCAQVCSASCADGWTCANVPNGADLLQICVPKWGFYCAPCLSSASCQVAVGTVGAACVDYGVAGSYCAASCNSDSDCPTGSICEASKSVEGTTSKQCVRAVATGSDPCSCSPRAASLGLSTKCFAVSGEAKCPGSRQCTAAGTLTPCDAPPAAVEVCDGLDNDCNGKTDDGLCDDGKPCTDDLCDPAGKACTYTNRQGACNDGTACTQNDACQNGDCQGQAVNCNDNNPCTTEYCDASKGCVYAPADGQCDDGDPCSVADSCKNAACAPGVPKDCTDGNACTQDGCNSASGGCEYKILTGSPCSDGNACTGPDACAGDTCKGTAANCDDGNPCTEDSCAPTTGCANAPTTLGCSDGNACTQTDTCDGKGGCVGLAIDPTVVCSDGNPCTADSCDQAKGCTNPAIAAPCDDNNPCTNGDVCEDAACKSGTNVCACQSDLDCAGKEDGNACNGILYCNKTSAPYVCEIKPGSIVTCDISGDSICKKTTCNQVSGQCVATSAPNGTQCDADGTVCTENDGCVGGNCVAGVPLNCDDGKPCTTDACDPAKGCSNVPNTLPCTDNNLCTVGDVCGGGVCLPGPLTVCDDNSVCTTDSCNLQTGNCQFVNLTGPCDADGSVCTEDDACDAGVCKPGPAKSCDDGKVCTTDACNPTTGCSNAANTASCDADGNACTVGDFCKDGGCQKGPVKDCDDASPCTIDSCNGQTGLCEYAPSNNGVGCTDGNACTELDSCDNGLCKPGSTKNCDDGLVCTTDGCDALTGCTNVTLQAGGPCNDGDICTKDDACIGIECKGVSFSCDDDNPCTTDACTGSGCTNTPLADTANPVGCAAGSGSHCIAGQCRVKGCGDGWLDPSNGEQCDDNNNTACDGCERCQVRKSLSLTGASTCLQLTPSESSTANTLGELSPTGDFTVELWVKPTAFDTEQVLVSKGQGATLWSLTLTTGATPGRLQWYQPGLVGVEPTSTTALTAGVWQHVAVVHRGSQVLFFVNGQPAGTGINSQQRVQYTGPLSIGCLQSGANQPIKGFAGLIDEVHLVALPLYARSFTPSRRVEPTPRTFGLWRFDEPAATPATTSDASGYGRTLPLWPDSLVVDECNGAPAASAVCGDGVVAAGYETCDEGALSQTNPCDGCNQCAQENTFVGVDAVGASNGNAIMTKALSAWMADPINNGQEVTIEAWIRTPATANTGVHQFFGTSCGYLEFFVQAGRLGVYREGMTGPPLFGTSTLANNTWHHVAAVIGLGANSGVRIYLNGKLDNTPASTLAAVNKTLVSADVALIGTGADAGTCITQSQTPAPGTTKAFRGQIDNLRISSGNRYGTVSQFTPPRQIYPDAQTLAMWRFDRPFGSNPLGEDSGNANVVDKTYANLVTADSCYGESTNTRVCGDAALAKYEVCDAGSNNGVPPATCTACSFQQTADTTFVSWSTPTTSSTLPNLGASAMSGMYKTSTAFVAWTFEGWVRLPALPASGTGIIASSSANSTSCGLNNDGESWRVAVDASGNDASFLRSGNTSTATKPVWRAGVWQHFALQYHGDGKGSLYVDGQLVRSYSGITPFWNDLCPVTFGGERQTSTTNNINVLGAQLAGIRWSKWIRYGQTFLPSWTLSNDLTTAGTGWSFSFGDFESGEAVTFVQTQKHIMKLGAATASATAGGPGTP